MPIQRWSAPVAGRVKAVVIGGLGTAVAVLFFPPWFGLPLAAVIGISCLAYLLLGAVVTLDSGAGTLALRWGLIVRRVRLADITAVLVEDSKLSVGRTAGGEISMYLWGRGTLDRWLGLPVVAGDIGHAVATASQAARSAAAGDAADAAVPDPVTAVRRGSSPASRSALATGLLAGLGLLSVCASLLVRHSWQQPVMRVLAVVLALVLGIGGVFYVCLSAALFASSARAARHRKLAG